MKELEAKIEQNKADQQKLKDEQVRLEASLAELDKPKLRHGDYGTAGNSPYFINDKHRCNSKQGRPFGISDDGGGQRNMDGPLIEFKVFGNVFDDIAAKGEELKRAHIALGGGGSNGIYIDAEKAGYIWLHFCEAGFDGRFVPLVEMKEYHANLGKVINYAENRKDKSDG